MSNIVIIGSGPAGISAALYAKRSGIETSVISMGTGTLEKAHLIENFYGQPAAISGEELHKQGVEQAKSLGVEIINDEVLGITFEDKLTVLTKEHSYSADAVIIATGQKRNAPKIPGLTQFEGAGVSYCATCDGFFHRGKDVAVLGNGSFAIHEAEYLSGIASSVTILTNGQEAPADLPENINCITTNIKELTGETLISSVVFEDESSISISGFFVATGSAGSSDFARKIGAMTEGNRILVNEDMMTNVPGLFACGDCTGGMLQVAKAVYEGAAAGTNASKYVKKL